MKMENENMSKATILIVEDETIVAADLASKVSQLGYEVSGMLDRGEDAINHLRKQRPDLVLMDIRLSGKMDGVEAAEIIRREFDLPVIYLTAHSDRATLERAKLTEPFGYILKPFDELALGTHIEIALYKYQAESRLRQAHDQLELRVEERTRELKLAEQELKEINETLERRVTERTAELESANILLRDSRRAALNLMEDAEAARKKAEQAEKELLAMNIDLEQRVEQRTRELQESQKQFLHAEKLSAIGKLSASIAHEFNNPLQGIISILKGVQKRAVMDEEDKQLLDAAIGEGDRIKNLIRSLQDFNRPSSDKKAMMDVHHSLDAILLLQKSDLNGKRIAVMRDFMEGLPRIVAVPDQIKQVFLNLLVNAADACSQTGGVITISTWQEDEKAAVAIRDTGVGIKPEDLEQIFQPFFTTKAEVKGTGLGLSVSYGIVKHHQGEILVESQPGEGTTFTVLLPIKCDQYPNERG